MKKSAGVFLLEIFLIVAGVLLGLAANEWHENRAIKKQAQTSLEYILLEVKNNQTRIKNLLSYHRSVYDSLSKVRDEILETKRKASFLDIKKALPKGFTVPLLQTTAWELANQIQAINHIDYKIAASLSKLYRLQAFCQKKLDKISENFYVASNVNPENMSNLILVLSALSGDILIQEEKLAKAYPEIINKLEEMN